MLCVAVRPVQPGRSRQVGDQVVHASFGVGEITHTFGSGEKVSIAVKFAGDGSKNSGSAPGPDRACDELRLNRTGCRTPDFLNGSHPEELLRHPSVAVILGLWEMGHWWPG